MEKNVNTYRDIPGGQAVAGHRGASFFSVTDIASAINGIPAYDKGFCIVEIISDDAGEPADYRFLEVNALFEELTGFKGASGKRVNELPEADKAAWQELFRQAARSQNPLHFEYRHQRNGRWLDIQVYCYAGRMIIGLDDITERKRIGQLLIEQKNILELIASGHSPEKCLTELTGAISRLAPDTRAAVLLADDTRKKFESVYSTDIPRSFGEGIHGAPINELTIGTCGSAVYYGKSITCTDIARDEKWSKPWRELCITHGILACHSEPVICTQGEVVASLMLCFPEARGPAPWERRLAAFGAHVAGIVIERGRAEEALRKSESFLQKAFSTETVGVLFFTLDGRMKDTNEAFVRMSGYSREELRTLPWQVLTPPEFVDVVMRVGQDLATRGETPPYEKQLIRKDGSRWWGLFAPARLTENGSESECVEFVVDITESKHAEQALRESEERLRLATDVARMYSWEYDMKTKLTKYSGNVERITGLKPGPDFKGNLELVHPEDRDLMEKAFENAMQTNGKFDFEMRLLPRGMRSDWYRISGMIVYNGKREPVRIIGISQKITRQKELERQKDEFISIASHELRTPVTSIKIYAEILEERLNAAEDRENAVLVSKLKAQTDRLTKLVYDLLDTTRIFEDRFLLQPGFFDLNDLIKENVEELQGIAYNNRLIIRPGPVQPVMADRERISQVLTNLISNAVKYSPAGGDVIISSEEAEDGVIVRIRDFGIGMSPETQNKVFERFYRAGDTHVNMNAFPGLGLGLYIASEIIKRHRGVIGLESKAGEGSVFYFKLPYNCFPGN